MICSNRHLSFAVVDRSIVSRRLNLRALRWRIGKVVVRLNADSTTMSDAAGR